MLSIRCSIFALVLALAPGFPVAAQTLAAAEALAKTQSGSADAWIALARARLQAGKAELAIAAAEKATQVDPRNALAFYWLGNSYGARIGQVSMFSKMGMATKLRDAFERSVQLDPSHLQSRSALIEYYLQAPGVVGGGVDKAKLQALEIAKRDKAQGFAAQGRIAMHEKNLDQALKFYQAAVAVKPGDSGSRIAVAVIYQQLEKWPEAFRLLRAWVAEDPSAGLAWYQIGRASAVSGQFLDEGAAALTRYLKLPHGENDPKKQHAYYRLGQIQARAGRKAEARVSLQAALKLDPKFADARAELAKL